MMGVHNDNVNLLKRTAMHHTSVLFLGVMYSLLPASTPTQQAHASPLAF